MTSNDQFTQYTHNLPITRLDSITEKDQKNV